MDTSWAQGRRSHEQHPLAAAGRRSSGGPLPPLPGADADDGGSSSYELVLREDSERQRLELSMARYRSAEVHSVIAGPDLSEMAGTPQELLAMQQREEQQQQAAGGSTQQRHLQRYLDGGAPQQASTAGLGEEPGSRQASMLKVLQPVPPGSTMTLSFHNVCGWVPASLQPPSVATRLKKALAKGSDRCLPVGREPSSLSGPAHQGMRQVMFDLSGVVKPGEVLALMGPSGSGKTTLLSVLGGRPPKLLEAEGSVRVNGRPLSKAGRRRIGYVLQDDVLYESLTVRETLTYAARLRLPRTMSTPDKLARAEDVMVALGLTRAAGTIIGGYFRRGVSGGERKRVSIGHELLINPSALLLDEPTSGLDSTTALHLLELLQQLAAGGRAVLTTIHQPSSRLYSRLDRLLLLAEGHAMYFGRADKVLDWFAHFSYQLPYGVSTADFILDLAMGEAEGGGGQEGQGGQQQGGGGMEAVRGLYAAWEGWQAQQPGGFTGSAQDYRLLEAGGNEGDAATADGIAAYDTAGERDQLQHKGIGNDSSAAQAPAAKQQQKQSPFDAPSKAGHVALLMYDGSSSPAGPDAAGSSGSSTSSSSEGLEVTAGGNSGRAKREGASYPEQVQVLVTRAAKVRRFESLTGQNLLQLLGVAIITGLLWWQRGRQLTVAAGSDVIGLLFFELLFPSFKALFAALFTFPNEFRMLTKERPSGMYRLSAYYAARCAADLPVELLNTLLFVTVVYFAGGLRLSAGAYLANLAAMMLIVLVAQSFGLLVGGVFMDPKTAQTVTTVVMLTFLLVGGFYVRSIPAWIAWIKYLSFVYWGYNLLVKVQFGHGPQYSDCGGFAGSSPASGCSPVSDLEAALQLPTSPDASPWPEVVVLLGMLLALRLLIYYVLRVKTRGRRLKTQ